MKRQYHRKLRKIGAYIGKLAEKLKLHKTQELLTCLTEIGVDTEKLPVFPVQDADWIQLLLLPHFEDQLCLECLRHNRIVYNVTDHQTGENICPFCGTVKNGQIISGFYHGEV